MITIEFECDTKRTITRALSQIEDNFIIHTNKSTINYDCIPIVKISFSDFVYNISIFNTRAQNVKILSCSLADFESLENQFSAEELFRLGYLVITS